ncbi:MAG TPA: type 1 glutamine amidotransferase domain-containing protein [Ktedonobacteraceae bacterium]
MSKKILTIVSEWGYWGEELLGPLEQFDAAGYETVFATPHGKRPVALPSSMNDQYIDAPLGRPVTSLQVAQKVHNLNEADRLNKPINLSQWVPEYPYWSTPNYLRELEVYYTRLDALQEELQAYSSIFIVGGSGPIVDLANNSRVHALILGFYKLDKLVAALCYGVACLAFARDLHERASIIRGKHVTGHCKEYDYKDNTGFVGTDFNMGPAPYPLEYILRDATAPTGAYHGNFGSEISVIVDYPFITGRSNHDSYATGQKIVEVLDHGLRRYGW